MKLWISLISLTLGPVACWIGCLPIGLHRQALDHEAVNMPVDLAVGREYTGPFHQAFIPTHGKQFRLQIEPRFDTIEEALAALADFKATLVVRSEEGEILLNQQLTVQDFEEDTSPGCRWYATLDPTTPYAFLRHFSIDDKACTLTLSVTTPAPSLAGREQRLVSKNVLCRTEGIADYLGWGVIFLGVLFILGGLRMLLSHFKRSPMLPRAAPEVNKCDP